MKGFRDYSDLVNSPEYTTTTRAIHDMNSVDDNCYAQSSNTEEDYYPWKKKGTAINKLVVAKKYPSFAALQEARRNYKRNWRTFNGATHLGVTVYLFLTFEIGEFKGKRFLVCAIEPDGSNIRASTINGYVGGGHKFNNDCESPAHAALREVSEEVLPFESSHRFKPFMVNNTKYIPFSGKCDFSFADSYTNLHEITLPPNIKTFSRKLQFADGHLENVRTNQLKYGNLQALYAYEFRSYDENVTSTLLGSETVFDGKCLKEMGKPVALCPLTNNKFEETDWTDGERDIFFLLGGKFYHMNANVIWNVIWADK